MESTVFEKHERLKSFPPALLVYILYRRIVEHGLNATRLWIKDKIVRGTKGFSVPEISQVADHVYVGGQHRPRGVPGMRSLGIDTVVNLRAEFDDDARGLGLDHYLWLPTTDDRAPTADELERGARFIEEHATKGRGVYIHCASGVGRAPTMAAAYLVWRGATPEQAWRTIRANRPFIRPTPPQMESVRALAERVSARRALVRPELAEREHAEREAEK